MESLPPERGQLFDGFNARIDAGAVQVPGDRRNCDLALFGGGANILRRLPETQKWNQTEEYKIAAHLPFIIRETGTRF